MTAFKVMTLQNSEYINKQKEKHKLNLKKMYVASTQNSLTLKRWCGPVQIWPM